MKKPETYRNIIDELVEMCHSGQGNIGARRALKGIWNQNATAEFLEDQHKINIFLGKLSDSDKEILAQLLTHQVVIGVFETLKVLEKYQIPPFENGYEDSPYNDFIGRVDKDNPWNWPK